MLAAQELIQGRWLQPKVICVYCWCLQVRAAFHMAKKHILVDEGQDTNLCQFELVSQITGPDTTLLMVGDPDQAIYGFRGARSDLLQQRFDQMYQGTSATYHLSDNYRSRPAIIRVADMIRQHE